MSTSVKNYFRRIKRLDLLAAQPDTVISKKYQNSKRLQGFLVATLFTIKRGWFVM